MKELSLDELANLVEEALPTLLTAQNPEGLYDPIKYIMQLKGKRIRPVAMLAAFQAITNKDPKEIIPQAVALEVFHNFTLVHDDIMDKAPLRRGKPTVHEKWSENHGILSGDAMMILCYQLLTASTNPNILAPLLRDFNQTALEVCEGQQEDMDFETSSNVTVDAYLEMIRKKTACLLAEAFRMGARLASSDEDTANQFYTFGLELGMSFQIQDDYLDAFGDPKKFGKKVGGDISSNKKTLLHLKAMELANPAQRAELENWITNDKDGKVAAVKGLYREIGVGKIARREIELHHNKAVETLEKISVEKKETLRNMVDLLSLRSS